MLLKGAQNHNLLSPMSLVTNKHLHLSHFNDVATPSGDSPGLFFLATQKNNGPLSSTAFICKCCCDCSCYVKFDQSCLLYRDFTPTSTHRNHVEAEKLVPTLNNKERDKEEIRCFENTK